MACCHGEIDGGYAWIVTAVSFLAHLMVYGVAWTNGVFFDAFLDVFPNSNSAIALVAALNTAFAYATGPITGLMINRLGHRKTSLIGGVVSGLGLVMSAFAPNVYYLYATFGVITGFGFGLSYLPFISMTTLYFKKYRTIALGLAVSGVGFGTFIFPPLIRLFITSYGWRGAMLLTGGLLFNVIPCGALLRPPRTTHSAACKDKPEPGRDNKGLFNLHVFRNLNYVILCVNNFFFIFGMSIVYVHLPAYAGSEGLDKDNSALLISAIGIANLIGRIAFGAFAKIPQLDGIKLYAGGFAAAGVVTILFPLFPTMTALLAVSACFGFSTASIGPLLPEVISEMLSLRLVPSGYGNLLLFEAFGNLLGPPCAGWLYQWTNHYSYSIYLAAAAILLSGIIMIAPLIRHKKLVQDQLQTEQSIVLEKKTYHVISHEECNVKDGISEANLSDNNAC